MRKRTVYSICLLVIVAVLMTFVGCGTSIEEEWSAVELGEHLPAPQKGELKTTINTSEEFYGRIRKVDESFFVSYKKECMSKGYIADKREHEGYYEAFNEEGFELSLDFYGGDEIIIVLHAPKEWEIIEWPIMGLGAMLPSTDSLQGEILIDNSDYFNVMVGNTTLNDYNAYVKLCESYGFIVNYDKQKEYYEAENTEGYMLSVYYMGGNRIEITLQAPKKEVSSEPQNTSSQNISSEPESSEAPSSESESSEVTSSKSDETKLIRKEFKEAMDSYEEFFDEYIAFMKKYKASNGADMTLLNDYVKYLSKYTEFLQEFDEWKGNDLNIAETAYYIEVQTRVNQKLLELSK